MTTKYIDADACPVKSETYKVAERYALKVIVVANQNINVPFDPMIQMELVSGDFDAADDWIVEKIKENDILITSDILLAARAIEKHAYVMSPKGKEWNEENIGAAQAVRELNSHLRDPGAKNTGPSAMKKSDRSNFLGQLDRIIQQIKRNG